jgi:hypothetical protein
LRRSNQTLTRKEIEMANKSRKKKQRAKVKRNIRRRAKKNLRRKANENLNKIQEDRRDEMKWITEMTEEHADWYRRNTHEKFRHIFKKEGEEGMREYFTKYRSPVVCRNDYGEVFEMGWEVENGRLFLFADPRMVPDGHGRFKCRDCGRRYFHCTCLVNDAFHPFPVVQQRRETLKFSQTQSQDFIAIIYTDNITNFNFEEDSLRSCGSIPSQTTNYECLNHLNIGG